MNKKKKTIFVFLGIPASGKGTQAKILASEKGLKMVSAGDLIRQIMAGDSNDPFVAEIKKRYEVGTPQPDEVVVDLFNNFLDESKDSVILDNFPFSLGQANFLDNYIENNDEWQGPVIISIRLNPEIAIKRAISRKICTDCGMIYGVTDEMICEKCGGPLIVRSDDNEETMRKRIDNYIPRLNELVAHYSKSSSGKLIEIDGSQSVPHVTEVVKEKINEYFE